MTKGANALSAILGTGFLLLCSCAPINSAQTDSVRGKGSANSSTFSQLIHVKAVNNDQKFSASQCPQILVLENNQQITGPWLAAFSSAAAKVTQVGSADAKDAAQKASDEIFQAAVDKCRDPNGAGKGKRSGGKNNGQAKQATPPASFADLVAQNKDYEAIAIAVTADLATQSVQHINAVIDAYNALSQSPSQQQQQQQQASQTPTPTPAQAQQQQQQQQQQVATPSPTDKKHCICYADSETSNMGTWFDNEVTIGLCKALAQSCKNYDGVKLEWDGQALDLPK